MTDTNWQIAYYISQFILVFIAGSAALYARAQLDTSKLFEMIRFVNEKKFRDARSVVIKEIEPVSGQEWWNDKKLEAAASEVCVCYNIMGLLLEADGYEPVRAGLKKRWRLILKHLAASIIRCHSSLEGFLEHRRSTVKTAYSGFSTLAAAAKPYARIEGSRTEN